MVYVTPVVRCAPARTWPFRTRARLLGDTNSEAMRFGLRLGLRRDWFRPGRPGCFLVTRSMRAEAVRRGAVEIEASAWGALVRMYHYSDRRA